MSISSQSSAHSADDSALGFYYQALFALLLLAKQTTDNAAVSVEQLDDVQLTADGQDLLFQLKHSLSSSPPPVSLKSKAFWKTIKAWIDILDEISLPETTLHLVTVSHIAQLDALHLLRENPPDTSGLVTAMIAEAEKVRDARDLAKAEKKDLPFADRADGCSAFLNLSEGTRLSLCSRIRLAPKSLTIDEIEPALQSCLDILPAVQRPVVAEKLVAWWGREIIHSLCGKRDRVISRTEFQKRLVEVIADLERESLSVDFEQTEPPEDYQPDGMLTRQIKLVKGLKSDVSKAIREEWRARAQRSLWIEANAGNATRIWTYDKLLGENWSDRHSTIKEECATKGDADKEAAGLELLRWSHNEAPGSIRPIEPGLNAAYYVRGSMQILAVNLNVGWHPDYEDKLKNGETK